MNKELIQRIYNNNVDINQYVLLKGIRDTKDFFSLASIRKIEGVYNLLQKKGFITDDFILTSIGEKILEEIGEEEIIPSIEDKKEISNFHEWVNSLHKKLQDKLIELTGKKQKVISGKYSFLPNATDLENKLEKFIRKYKITDLEKAEKVLLSYVDKCNKARWEMCMLVDYYIMKNDSSKMMTDYELFDETDSITKTEDKSSIEGVYFG